MKKCTKERKVVMSYSCNTACIIVLISYTVATEEELNLVKQMLEQKEREINDLTSLLAMKEGKKSDVMMNFVIFLKGGDMPKFKNIFFA